jgi:tRNA (guanine37-N1)-methyltransferase
VPDVLQVGDHGKIAVWRRQMGLRRTWQNRPDLLFRASLTEAEQYLLADFVNDDQASISENAGS